ncbi:MAG: ORF6N domain-containing protein [Muribaculaceae bacterium]|nr:ORF6N domain-containing protein [Muribaculaceae bacterium]
MADIITTSEVKDVIIPLRGEEVILDFEVAKLYGVETKRINEAVKNNPEKFPTGFVLELTKEEWKVLRSKISTLEDKNGKGNHPKYLPKAFTERGLYMLATILKSPIATQTTLAIVNTFAQVREVRRQILAMHAMEGKMDKKSQMNFLTGFGNLLTDILMPEMETSDTETSMELNFVIGKLKHTVKRSKKKDEVGKLISIAKKMLEKGYSEEDIADILK